LTQAQSCFQPAQWRPMLSAGMPAPRSPAVDEVHIRRRPLTIQTRFSTPRSRQLGQSDQSESPKGATKGSSAASTCSAGHSLLPVFSTPAWTEPDVRARLELYAESWRRWRRRPGMLPAVHGALRDAPVPRSSLAGLCGSDPFSRRRRGFEEEGAAQEVLAEALDPPAWRAERARWRRPAPIRELRADLRRRMFVQLCFVLLSRAGCEFGRRRLVFPAPAAGHSEPRGCVVLCCFPRCRRARRFGFRSAPCA